MSTGIAHSTDADDLKRALAQRVGKALVAKGWLLAVAESCTGGLIAGALTAISGSSGWFERGFVTYSNDAKIEMLGVRPATLDAFGAVSEPTAAEMALGALDNSRSHISVAVTGIAGPDGGTAEKPVGTVCFAWARQDGQVDTRTRRFDGDRDAVRTASVEVALAGLLDRLN